MSNLWHKNKKKVPANLNCENVLAFTVLNSKVGVKTIPRVKGKCAEVNIYNVFRHVVVKL